LVDRYMADNVDDITDVLDMPEWDEEALKVSTEGSYGEQRYNRWTSEQRKYILLDRAFYRKPPGVQVEVCDLLTREKQLICVKRMDGSDKMSHLFQQGSVSAQLLMTEEEYRANVVSSLRSLDPGATFGRAEDWTIVYAIATGRQGMLRDSMYFFAKAALRTHAQAIKQSGIRVAIAKIQRSDASS